MQIKYRSIFLAFVTSFAMAAHGQDFRLLYGLRGDWKFEIGDDKRWAAPQFDDSKWERIFAPAAWEDEGFPGYDGYAWYRKHFQAEADWKDKSLYLRLGRIDDVDEVYVNGKLIGASGAFPSQFETAYNVDRDYPVPVSCVNTPGDNVVAVRVYDDTMGGGIYSGRLGVYEDRNALIPELPLAGEWKFRTGDESSWKEKNVDEKHWSTIRVPGNWEFQGHGAPGNWEVREFGGYDGYAWYRIHFHVPKEYADKRMILVLGKIDDFDETYLNGQLVGKTGTMGRDVQNTTEWQQLRAYTLHSGQLQPGKENVIAVRVFDGYRGGGIYAGPIGITSRERYMKWNEKNRRGKDSFLDWLR